MYSVCHGLGLVWVWAPPPQELLLLQLEAAGWAAHLHPSSAPSPCGCAADTVAQWEQLDNKVTTCGGNQEANWDLEKARAVGRRGRILGTETELEEGKRMIDLYLRAGAPRPRMMSCSECQSRE